jgi:hypothetical protein
MSYQVLALFAQRQNDFEVEASGGPIPAIIMLAIVVLVIAGIWKVFTKAGQPG